MPCSVHHQASCLPLFLASPVGVEMDLLSAFGVSLSVQPTRSTPANKAKKAIVRCMGTPSWCLGVPCSIWDGGKEMDHDHFWHLVDLTRGFPERAEALAKLLEQLESDEIVRFRIMYDDVMHSANKVDLWGAAHTINGGCSDEGFYYFREALIEQGRPIFEAAVRDPDSLADIANPGEDLANSEGLGNAP